MKTKVALGFFRQLASSAEALEACPTFGQSVLVTMAERIPA